MRLGQIKRLAHAAGISTPDLKDILSTNDSHAAGFGVLMRGELEQSVVNELQSKLRNGLNLVTWTISHLERSSRPRERAGSPPASSPMLWMATRANAARSNVK